MEYYENLGDVWFEEMEERRGEKWKGREKKEEGNKEIKFYCLI